MISIFDKPSYVIWWLFILPNMVCVNNFGREIQRLSSDSSNGEVLLWY